MAQSRLQELQDDLAGLRKSLQDTQSQLRDKEAENALLKSGMQLWWLVCVRVSVCACHVDVVFCFRIGGHSKQVDEQRTREE